MVEEVTCRIAVCDDEKIFREQVIKQIRAYDDRVVLHEYTSGDKLLQTGEVYDLIFLDIEMPGSNGMVTAKKLREKKVESHIVFLTTHKECVFDAFKVRAFRFLNKPVNPAKLREVLQELEKEKQSDERIVVEQKGKSFDILLKHVVYLEAFGDGTYIYDKYGQVYSSSMQLKEWEEKLQEKGFYRIHKSYMVSMAYVKSRDKEMLELSDLDVTLKIARRNVGEFKEAYLNYVDKNAKTR
ncbi:MAG: response regulator transcription factor [Lachnospiraceae bacterium]|nr:response regulator transcription factor [Lachnospiraceae bacterium]